jgi:hypothetical protein
MTRPRSMGYHACWKAAEELGRFDRETLAAKAGCTYHMASKWMREWVETGLLTVVGVEDRKTIHQVVARPETAPSDRIVPRRIESPRGNMWTAMRQMTTFGPLDISVAASTETTPISPALAVEYCRMLLRIGYLRVIRKAVPGVRDPVYRLIRNTGPRPPVERRVALVWDPNTEAWLGHPESVL